MTMSRNEPGSCCAIEYSSGGTNPGLGKPDCCACWSQSAIMPATSGAAALVPPTYEIVWPGAGRSPGRRVRADDRVAGARVCERGDVGNHPVGRSATRSPAATTAGPRSVLVPPPPPAAVADTAPGTSCRSTTPEDAIAFAGVSVRFVPPTASTQGDVAGQDADRCLSKLSSCDGGTPCAHADEPLSPAATTVVIPSADVAASWRSNSVRAAVYGLTLASQTP